jgi:LemA protein
MRRSPDLEENSMSFRNLRIAAVLALTALVSACGVNNVPTLQEKANAAWGEVQNQYQRRADLIPNLVETVKGYAQQEKDVLVQVTEARAKATSVKVDASTITDPAKFKEFQDAQNQLSGALGRLLATVEAYPELKSNANFLALQSQLEGTENRIAVARRDYIGTVREYNTELRTIPGRWIAAVMYPDAKPMEVFTATAGSDRPPAVKF